MTMQELRRRSRMVGNCALVLGMLVSITGACLGNVTVTGVGGLMLSMGAYAVAYAHVGSF